MPISISDATVSLALFRPSANSAISANQTALTTAIESSMPQASGPAAVTSHAQARLLELMLDITPVGQKSDKAADENPEPPTSVYDAVTDPAQRKLLDQLDVIPRGPSRQDYLNSLTDEKIAAGWTKWGSPGVKGYETLEEIEDPELRAMFEHVQKKIDADRMKPGGHNWDEDIRGASKALTSGFDDYFRQDLGEAKYTTSDDVDIPTLEGAIKSLLGEKYTIEGELAFQKDDGTYLMGKFEIRNNETGEVQLSHQGDGKVNYFDQGVIWKTNKV